MGVLREQEAGMKTADVCRKHGISPATVYQWKAKFGGLEVSEARRVRTLEAENARLNKLLAGATLKDIAGKNGSARRAAAGCGRSSRAPRVSERRACQGLGADRSVVRYRTCRSDDAAIRQRLRSLAGERCRFEYRRLTILLAREGVRLNHKRSRRLYREERLQVRRRRSRKRALGTRRPMSLPAAKVERWSLNFVSDTHWPTDGASAACAWLTILRASVWRWWRKPRRAAPG